MDVVIRQEMCVGCGACVKDCLRDLLYLEEGKARMKEGVCIRCGHCVAVCPADAVRLEGCPEEELHPYEPAAFDIPASQLMNFMQFRRSVRHFQARPLEEEKLTALLDAARYAPTGGNVQKNRYILLDKDKDELIELTLKTLADASEHMDSNPMLKGAKRYQEKWRTMYRDWKEQGKDGLFFHAPWVVMVVARYPKAGTGRLDAGLASANMELMAHALGLGVCYIGFFTMAAALEPELYRRLGVQAGEEVVSTMAIGYPDVKYCRTVNRNPADLTRF